MTNQANSGGKARRGFASMHPDVQREIASKGGKAAHAPGGNAHKWTSEEAKAAGRKGGQVSRGGRGRQLPREQPALPAPPVSPVLPSESDPEPELGE